MGVQEAEEELPGRIDDAGQLVPDLETVTNAERREVQTVGGSVGMTFDAALGLTKDDWVWVDTTTGPDNVFRVIIPPQFLGRDD